MCSHSAQYPTLLFRYYSRFDRDARKERDERDREVEHARARARSRRRNLRRLRNPSRFVIVTQFAVRQIYANVCGALGDEKYARLLSTPTRVIRARARALPEYLRYSEIVNYWRIFSKKNIGERVRQMKTSKDASAKRIALPSILAVSSDIDSNRYVILNG